jgi:hypothetical protein
MMKKRSVPLEMTLAEVTDAGKVIREERCHSFHAAFIYWMAANFNNANLGVGVQEIGGASVNMAGVIYNGADETGLSIAGLGDLTKGIVAGTGNSAVVKTDYALETPVVHGTGSGQLYYNAMSAAQPSKDATDAYYDLTRSIQNQSGNTINIEEIAWYFRKDTGTGPFTGYTFMADRTLFEKALGDGETVNLRYRLQTA